MFPGRKTQCECFQAEMMVGGGGGGGFLRCTLECDIQCGSVMQGVIKIARNAPSTRCDTQGVLQLCARQVQLRLAQCGM